MHNIWLQQLGKHGTCLFIATFNDYVQWRTPNSSRDSNVSPSIKQRNKEELEHAP
jgi:hypothetical protein